MNTGNQPPPGGTRVERLIERARALNEDDRWRLLVYLSAYSPDDMEHALNDIEHIERWPGSGS